MLRRLYTLLVRLHPRGFRDRFGDDMLWIFDRSANTGNRAWLLADATSSALRQHLLRSGAESSVDTTVRHSSDGVPLFLAVDTSRPRSWILLHGGLLTFLAWYAFSIGMGAGNQRRAVPLEFAGVHYLVDSRLVPPSAVTRNSPLTGQLPPGPPHRHSAEQEQPPETHRKAARRVWSRMLSIFGLEFVPEPDAHTILKSAGPESPLAQPGIHGHRPSRRRLMRPRLSSDTYASDPLMSAIDLNGDLAASAAEIARAPHSLLSLDRNHDGKLTAEECALAGDSLSKMRRSSRFFAALDTDRNGELSAQEIAEAAGVLALLDGRQRAAK